MNQVSDINRIKWLDVSKGIGIFLIYLGHMGNNAGLLYPFVFIFHVPLFFFISGCTESIRNRRDFFENMKERVLNLLIPFYFFAFFSLIFIFLKEGISIDECKSQLSIILGGCIRNNYLAGSLWFLTCLFTMSLFFSILRKLNNKLLILGTGILMFWIYFAFINPQYANAPKWYYNIDSVFYYIVFYILGYVCFPFLQELFKLNSMYKKVIFAILTIITTVYSFLLLLQKDVLDFMNYIPIFGFLTPIFRAMIVITMILLVSFILQDYKMLNCWGRTSLFLCGSEFVVKSILDNTLGMIGLRIDVSSPLVSCIYTALVLLIAYYLLIPFERKVLDDTKYRLNHFGR